jgi:hypothetical protein
MLRFKFEPQRWLGKQPWRTVLFIVGSLATIALMLDIVWLMIRST